MKIIKKYKSQHIIILILFFTMTITGGCDFGEVLNEKPPHLLTAETLFIDYEGFETGVNGLYALMRNERIGVSGNDRLRGQMTWNGTDIFAVNQRLTSDFTLVAEEWGPTNDPSFSAFQDQFEWRYEIINSANTIINRAGNPEVNWRGDPEGNKNYILAEAKAARAWSYRSLTYLFGDVPLTFEEASGATIKTDWTRTPVHEIRLQIIEDLLFAEQHIPVLPNLQGRMTKGAIQHYLSEMFIVMNDPESALFWANKAINNPEYHLVTERYGVRANETGVPFADMFLPGNTNREEGNTEALWVFQFERGVVGGSRGSNMRREFLNRYWNWSIDGVRPLQTTFERGGQGFGRAALTKFAYNLFEPQDDRFSNHAMRRYFILKTAEENAPWPADALPPGYSYGDTLWTANLTVEELTLDNRARPDWPYPRKHDDTEPDILISPTHAWKDQPYLRLAETYLLKAEAQYLIGDLAGAAESINIIRRRSNASEITTSDVDIDFILDERARELMAEEQRRFHLLRTGKWFERVRKYNAIAGPRITERDTLFPIPQNVIDANITLNMPQNPGF